MQILRCKYGQGSTLSEYWMPKSDGKIKHFERLNRSENREKTVNCFELYILLSWQIQMHLH